MVVLGQYTEALKRSPGLRHLAYSRATAVRAYLRYLDGQPPSRRGNRSAGGLELVTHRGPVVRGRPLVFQVLKQED